MSLLDVRNASKLFRDRAGQTVTAFDSVNLVLEQGESLGLVGESGSGKSTLARCICRLIPLSGGEIRLNGLPWSQLRGRKLRAHRWRMQLIFQDPYRSLNPYMKVRRIVEEPLLCSRQDTLDGRRRRAEALLAAVGLEAELWERFPSELSGGQRQRVAIARALAPEPQVLIADEPVSSLDRDTSLEVLRLLDRLIRERRLSLLLISHDLAMVKDFCERTAVMFRGRIVESQATKDLFAQPVHPYTRQLLAAARHRSHSVSSGEC